jgi:6-phospho-3-hexuloisomerase
VASFQENWHLILAELQAALSSVKEDDVERLIDAILCADKVFVLGIGRVLLALQAFAKRLNHLGIPTWFVGEINEPAITPRDLLVVASGSGETVVPVALAKVARNNGARIAHLGSNPESSLAPLTDIFVRIPVRTKLERADEIHSQQIMTSLFEQCVLIVGDAVALRITERRSITDMKSLWAQHSNLE